MIAMVQGQLADSLVLVGAALVGIGLLAVGCIVVVCSVAKKVWEWFK